LKLSTEYLNSKRFQKAGENMKYYIVFIIALLAIPGALATPPVPSPTECRNLWWYDSNSVECGYKQFCGAYAYQGLFVYETKEECLQSLNPPEVVCPVGCTFIKATQPNQVDGCECGPTTTCPVGCVCDENSNVIKCETVSCPINCKCDEKGNVIVCESPACPENCKCDEKGNTLVCNDYSCPEKCVCDEKGNILKCGDYSCPNNCKCDEKGNAIVCESPTCPANCECDEKGNILYCGSPACPENCVCDKKGNAIECQVPPTTTCPINCECKNKGNETIIISCDKGSCPVPCKCDENGVVITCAFEPPTENPCPKNCICDANGPIECWKPSECPEGCYCDASGKITTCPKCPENCVCTENTITCSNEKILTFCQGCELDESTCLPIGTRVDNKFCGLDKTMTLQYEADAKCSNNFECSTNLCIDSQCVSSGLIQKILAWFKGLFG